MEEKLPNIANDSCEAPNETTEKAPCEDTLNEPALSESKKEKPEGEMEIASPENTSAMVSAVQTAALGASGIVVKKSVIVIALVAVAFLLVGSLLLGMWIPSLRGDGKDGIDPAAKNYTGAFINAGDVDANSITVPGYADVFFPAGKKQVQIVLLNPDQNPCYFRFSLLLGEDGEELYRSGLIPPGMAVTEIELSRALDAGEYALCIRIEAFSLADRSEMNGADIETKLIVSR